MEAKEAGSIGKVFESNTVLHEQETTYKIPTMCNINMSHIFQLDFVVAVSANPLFFGLLILSAHSRCIRGFDLVGARLPPHSQIMEVMHNDL